MKKKKNIINLNENDRHFQHKRSLSTTILKKKKKKRKNHSKSCVDHGLFDHVSIIFFMLQILFSSVRLAPKKTQTQTQITKSKHDSFFIVKNHEPEN